MRRVLVLALLALALPIVARADIGLTNDAGTITLSGMAGTNGLGTINTTTLSTAGSHLMTWDSVSAAPNGALGRVDYSTGVLLSGSVANGGTFSGTGSSFNITGVGAWATKLTGTPCGTGCALFTGSFNGPITWSLTSSAGQRVTYSLSGDLTGTTWLGHTVTGNTVQNIYTFKDELVGGKGNIGLSTSNIITPEPGTLGLLGTGLLGIAGLFRRKLMGS